MYYFESILAFTDYNSFITFYKSSFLLDTKEILYFQQSIFFQIGAMNGIDCSRLSEFSSYCIWSQVLSNLWIGRSTEFSECFDGILLSHLQYNAWASSHVFNHTYELWKYSFVDFEELFCGRPIESEHLHR